MHVTKVLLTFSAIISQTLQVAKIEFSLIYHFDDIDVVTAVRYAANRIVETSIAASLKRKGSYGFFPTDSSPALNYFTAATGQFLPNGGLPMLRAGDSNKKSRRHKFPKLIFREIPADFDNLFSAGDEICKLLEANKLIIMIGYRLEHIALLRSYSREFHIPLILLDTGIDRLSDLVTLNDPPNSSHPLSKMESPFFLDSVPFDDDVLSESPASLLATGGGGEWPSPYELQFGIPYTAAVYKAMKQKKWKSFFIVYDSEDGLRRIYSLFRRMSMDRKIIEAKIKKLDVGAESEAAEDLRFYHRDSSNVLIDIKNVSSFIKFATAVRENDLFNDQTDYIVSGLNFDSDMEDVILPLNLRTRNAKLSGFHVMARLNVNSQIGELANVQKVLRDWRNLDPRVYPAAGTSRLTANQAFAIDFAAALANILKRWMTDNPNSFGNLRQRNQRTINGSEAVKCMTRTVHVFDLGPEIAKRLRNIRFQKGQTLTGSLAFNQLGERINYTIDYYGQENMRVGFRKLGQYNEQTGFKYIPADVQRHPRNPRKPNATRVITTILAKSFLRMKDDAHRRVGNDRFEGYIADLAAAVAELAKFKYEFRLVGDHTYGSVNATGHWNGMIGEVITGVADMAIAPLTITAGRENVVDFTKPFMTLGTSIMIKKPLEIKPSAFMFLTPVSFEIWILSSLAFIAVSVVLFLVSRISPYQCYDELHSYYNYRRESSQRGIALRQVDRPQDSDEQQRLAGTNDDFRCSLPAQFARNLTGSGSGKSKTEQNPTGKSDTLRHASPVQTENVPSQSQAVEEPQSSSKALEPDLKNEVCSKQLRRKKFVNTFTLSNAFWFTLGGSMRQGVNVPIRSISGRIAGSVWWIFTLVLISAYIANLFHFLTVKRLDVPIESAEDLVKQTEIKYGALRRSSTSYFLMTSNHPVYQQMWEFMVSTEPSVFTDTIDEGIRRCRESNGRYAFLVESTMNDYVNSRKPCDTMKVGPLLDSKGYGIATPKGSDLKEALNLAILEMRETGELQRLYEKWWVAKGECDTSEPQRKNRYSSGSLTLLQYRGLFYIIAGGVAAGMLVLACELLYRTKCGFRSRTVRSANLRRE